jgi:hypothetical protein
MLFLEEKNKKLHLIVKGILTSIYFRKNRRFMEVLLAFVVLHYHILTSPCIECGFAFVLISQCSYTSEFDHVCLMEPMVALLFNVVIAISSFLFSSLLAVYSSWISPPSRNRTYISKYRSIEKFMKLPFQRVSIHRKWSSNKEVMSILLDLLES